MFDTALLSQQNKTRLLFSVFLSVIFFFFFFFSHSLSLSLSNPGDVRSHVTVCPHRQGLLSKAANQLLHVTIIGGSGDKYHRQTLVCRDKTRLLLRQKYACRDKTFVVTKTLVCRDKRFVATSIILARQMTCFVKYLSRQEYFVMTIIILSRQAYFCRDK